MSARAYVLLIMCLVYATSAMDKSVISILLQPIKAEFDLSDTQLGFLVGLSSAIFNVLAAIPLGRLADTWHRTKLISISVAVFSVMTGLCGFVGTIWQLFLIRIGVAIGEAGPMPSANSILADLYPAKSRGTAMAIYTLGGFAGSFLAYALGGPLAEAFGWRRAFQILAIPGICLAAIVLFTVAEPQRGGSDQPRLQRPSLRQALTFLFRQRSFLHLLAGSTLVFMCTNGIVTWLPSFFQRSFGMGLAETGFLLGIPVGFICSVGILASGLIGDRIGGHNVAWRAWIVTAALCAALPFCLGTLLATDKIWAIGAWAVAASLNTFYVSPMFSLAQGLAPPQMRATAVSLIVVCLGIVGTGLGPQIVGLLSDMLRASFGVESLRVSLMIMLPALAWAALHFYRAGKHLESGMARAQEFACQKA